MARFDPAVDHPTTIIQRNRSNGARPLAVCGVRLLAALLSLVNSGAPSLAGQPQTPPATSRSAPWFSRATDLPQAFPVALRQKAGRHLVLSRSERQLLLMEDGEVLRRFPVAVGMPGWETPSGTFEILEKIPDPIWEHPENGSLTPAGATNPLGSRWIGFHRDCDGRSAWNGEKILDVKGCVVMGFHGTPHRWTVGHAVSHGCVRLYDEDVQSLYDLVEVGTQVTVLP